MNPIGPILALKGRSGLTENLRAQEEKKCHQFENPQKFLPTGRCSDFGVNLGMGQKSSGRAEPMITAVLAGSNIRRAGEFADGA